MEQLEGNYQDFTDAGSQMADKTALVRFHVRPMADQAATKREGRPIYKNVDYIEIRYPGQKDSFCDVYRPYKHQERFGHHYDKWKSTQEQPELHGTPLDRWGAVEANQIKELAFFNVHTVEQMAAMADIEVSKFMNGQTLKRKAQEYLEATKGAAELIEIKQEMAAKDSAIADMQEQMAAMKAQMEAMQEEKPKRGRPRKSVDDSNSE